MGMFGVGVLENTPLLSQAHRKLKPLSFSPFSFSFSFSFFLFSILEIKCRAGLKPRALPTQLLPSTHFIFYSEAGFDQVAQAGLELAVFQPQPPE